MGKSEKLKGSWGPTYERDIFVIRAAGVVMLLVVLFLFIDWATVSKWMDKDGSPAWVQAWGSVGAILVAMAIAGWQKNAERIDRRLTHSVQAQVVADGVLLSTVGAIGVLDGLVTSWTRNAEEIVIRTFVKQALLKLETLDLATDEQLLFMANAWPSAVQKIVRGRTLIVSTKKMFANRLSEVLPERPLVKSDVDSIIKMLSRASWHLYEGHQQIYKMLKNSDSTA